MEYNIQHACIIYITPAVPDAVVMQLQIWHFLHPSKVKFSKILIYICHMINHCEKKLLLLTYITCPVEYMLVPLYNKFLWENNYSNY